MNIINYKDLEKGYYSGVSISRNEKEGYYSYLQEDGFGECNYLMPDKDFEGKIEGVEQIRDYVRQYYINVLSKLEPGEVYETFRYNNLVTFDDGEFSHGNIISAWIELFLEIDVPIIKRESLGGGLYKMIRTKNPSWVMDVLEEEIKKIVDMRGFNSVRALSLFMRSEALERMADEEEDRLLSNHELSDREYNAFVDRISNYRQIAYFRRCDADMAEEVWRERRCKLIETVNKKTKRKKI